MKYVLSFRPEFIIHESEVKPLSWPDGAPAIDLIDGDLLVDKLKELGLGVKTEKIEAEKVTIDEGCLLSI